MPRHRNKPANLPADLPVVPAERPEAVAARRVVERAAVELRSRQGIVAEAAMLAAQSAYQDVLRQAAESFRADMTPILAQAVTDAGKAAAELAKANRTIEELCDFMRAVGAAPPVDASKLAFRRAPSDAEEADALAEERRRMLLPTFQH